MMFSIKSKVDYDIAVLGHITKDNLIIRGVTSEAAGGAVYYSSLALSRLNISSAAITLINKDDDQYLDAMRHSGVKIFSFDSKQTTEFTLTYTSDDLDKRTCIATASAGPFTKAHIPNIHAKVFHIGSLMAGEVPDDLVRYITKRFPKVSLDLQGFLRVQDELNLGFKDWPGKKVVLKNIHTVKADTAEAEVITGEKDMFKAAKLIADWGPKEIVITHTDGVMIYAGEEYIEVPFIIKSLKGRTGRGDTCISAYLAARLNSSPRDAAMFAAAMTSLKLEKEGSFDLSHQDVRDKMTKDYNYEGTRA